MTAVNPNLAKHPPCTASEAWSRVERLTAWAFEPTAAKGVAQRVLPYWIEHALLGGCKDEG